MTPVQPSPQPDFVALSVALVEAVRQKSPLDDLLEILARADLGQLAAQLSDDRLRKVFWINVYNSQVIHLLRNEPDLYEKRSAFFQQKRLFIAGTDLSFDDVEHGILRRSKVKVSLGYIDKPLVPDYEKQLRVDSLDWRVHFALNCGAGSCPPVVAYTPGSLEELLDARTRFYLETTTHYDPQAGKAVVNSLMNWYQDDFGGMEGVRLILAENGLIPADAKPVLTFGDYNWALDLDNFVTT